MSSDNLIAVLALLLSLASVALSGWFSVCTATLRHRLEEERQDRLEAESAIKAAKRVYEPLAQAAADLQSRIFNIVETGWVPLMDRYKSHGDYAVVSTAFLFAHYFGWLQARRWAVLSSGGGGDRDESVQHLIDGVLKTLRRSDDSEGFLFFTAEQRAIGELMCTMEVVGSSDVRAPTVMGYATFAERYRTDEPFRAWFSPIDTGMELVAEGDVRRLVDIQHALVKLIDELDPKRRFTVGYDLSPIDISDNPEFH